MSNLRFNAWMVVIVLMLAPLGLLPAQQTNRVRFNVLLSPSNETPPVVGVDAGGTAVISFLLTHTPPGESAAEECDEAEADCEVETFVDPNEIGEVTSATVDFLVNYAFGATETVRAMHIHRGVLGQGGPVVVDAQFGAAAALTGSGSFFRSVVLTDPMALEVVKGILANPTGYYLNVHTESNPSGLLRGQLVNTPEVISGRENDSANETQMGILAKLNLIQATLEQIRLENLAQRDTTNRIAERLGVVPQSPGSVSPADLAEVEVPCLDEDEDGEDDETGQMCDAL